ncbi:MAG: hypothetical protein JXR70_16275 [Spirochaetales bacterium]|nr:hypothetical protein [Spirochaetales bacterium]
MTISVPANLLLAGEYLILEPHVRGLIFSCEPRIFLTCKPAESFCIESDMGNQKIHYQQGGSNKLFNAVEKVFSQKYPAAEIFKPWKITINSSAFFKKSGEKKGFGSSAAVTISYCACLFRLCFNRQPENNELFQLSLEAHRLFQDGRGSGYDIAASIYGGFRAYQSLPVPKISEPISWPFHSAKLRIAEKPVSTPEAVKKYELWKSTHQTDFQIIKTRYKALVNSLCEPIHVNEKLGIMQKIKELFLQLGDAIGVDSYFPEDKGDFCKSLGAGNEIAILLNHSSHTNTTDDLIMDTKGIQWNAW